jgi:hypothetical protein
LAAHQLLLVIWLPLVVAPWAYLVGAFSQYELFFIRLNLMRRPRRALSVASRLRLMKQLGLSRRALTALDGAAAHEAALAGTLPEIVMTIEACATNVQ